MPASANKKRKRESEEAHETEETNGKASKSAADILMEKSEMWPDMSGEKKRKKRTRQRADARRLTTFDRPEMFTKTRADNLLLTMAYCALAGISFRECALNIPAKRHHKFAERINECGAVWETAYEMYSTYTSCIWEFIKTLQVLHEQHNPERQVNSYTKLSTVIRESLSAHTLTITPETVQGKCDIDGKDIKNTDTANMIVLEQYVYAKNEDNSVDYGRMRVFPPTPPIVISKKYGQIVFAAWYLFNLHLIVGNDCLLWVESVKKMPLAKRKKCIPAFIDGNHANNAKLYIQLFSGGCNNVREKITLHTKFFRKITSDYKKKIKPSQESKQCTSETKRTTKAQESQ